MKPLTQEEQDFVSAIQDFQKEQDKLFLSWSEVLQIVKDLGYTRQTSYNIYETRAREIIEQMGTDPDLMDNWHQDLEDEAQGDYSRGDTDAYFYCEKVKTKVWELLEGRE
jgi:hypothetical protein